MRKTGFPLQRCFGFEMRPCRMRVDRCECMAIVRDATQSIQVKVVENQCPLSLPYTCLEPSRMFWCSSDDGTHKPLREQT